MPIQQDNILQLIFSFRFVEYIRDVIALTKRLKAFLQERRLQGIYEVLEQRRTVTIHDPQGHVVTVDTMQRVRFRQNHVAALVDYIWGDGHILTEYTCSPGVPVDCYKEGSRYVVVISLREQRNCGEELCLRTHRKIVDGFTRRKECWETDIYHRTHQTELKIIFPRERRCQRAALCQRNTGKTTALGPEHMHRLPDGRQKVCWALRAPRLHERYLLHWEW